MTKQPVDIIGRVELIDLPSVGALKVPAKIDTGADGCSIWATNISIEDNKLCFSLFGPGSDYYDGKIICLPKSEYHQRVISNSFGHKERRYVVHLSVVVMNRRIKTKFTLADRSSKLYPILLGRRLLNKKFIVDVSKNGPIHEMHREQQRLRKKGIELPEGKLS